MSPLDIEVLLHYHSMDGHHPRVPAPAVENAIQKLLSHDILRIRPMPPSPAGSAPFMPYYTTTPRGAALVNVLCNTPYPEERTVFVDQNGKVIES